MAPVIAGIETVTEGLISRKRGMVAIDGGWATLGARGDFCCGGGAVTAVGLLIAPAGFDIAVIGQRIPGVSGHISAAREVVALLCDFTQPAGITQRLLLSVVQLSLHNPQIDVHGEEVIAAAGRFSLTRGHLDNVRPDSTAGG